MINIMAFIVLLCLFPQNMGIVIGVDPSPYPKCFRNENKRNAIFGGINQCSDKTILDVGCWMCESSHRGPNDDFFFGETAVFIIAS